LIAYYVNFHRAASRAMSKSYLAASTKATFDGRLFTLKISAYKTRQWKWCNSQ